MNLHLRLLFLIPLLTNPVYGEEARILTIGVVDTGLDLTDLRLTRHLCPSGHYNETNTSLDDTDGHGTHIAGIIQGAAGEGLYCLKVCKYYQPATDANEPRYLACLNDLLAERVDIINLSSGGDKYFQQERDIIATHIKTLFVTAAGNDNLNLDMPWNSFYPASYALTNEVVVGSLGHNGQKSSFSNFGRIVNRWEYGEDVLSLAPGVCNNGYCMARISGTSQAAAIATGKIIKKWINK